MKKHLTKDEQRKIVANNLSKLLKDKQKTVADVAEAFKLYNIPSRTVYSWFNGEKYPRIDKVQLLADYFDVLKSDITEEKTLPGNLTALSPSDFKRIPILGTIACGDPILAEQNIEGYAYESLESLPKGNIFALRAKGDSMEPTIPNGSIVLIREQSDVESGEIAAVLVNGDTEATLKRVKRLGQITMLMPDNTKHDPIPVTKEKTARIIGKAVGFRVNF